MEATPTTTEPLLPISDEATVVSNAADEDPELYYLGHLKTELFNTDPEIGLTDEEADRRLEIFGRNEITDEKTHPLIKLMYHFIEPMALMIWLAILIEAINQDWYDFGVLMFLQILNAVVGWWEDYKAGNAVDALRNALKPEAYVRRGGVTREMASAELVPGDLVLLAAGKSVPADVTICEGQKSVSVDQAALTGESLPVTMYPGDVAKMGSNITRGESDCIVTATAGETFFGRTAGLVASVNDMGHFQKVLLQITFVLLGISILLVSVNLGYLLFKGSPVLDAIAFSVVLLVASIPIAMQVVCTTTMALGCRKLAAEKAIVTRLSSIEELAGMNMLCSDKTGTLTLGKMRLQDDAVIIGDFTRYDLIVNACLASKWKEPAKDAIDTLVLNALPDKNYLNSFTQTDFVPFDPSIKRTESTLVSPEGETFQVSKGAPQVILDMTSNKEDIQTGVEEKLVELAKRGIRCLAIAKTLPLTNNRVEDAEWIFMGLLTFLDPPRPDTKQTIARAREYGVQVKMITGDQKAIAVETCRILNMGMNIMGAESLPSLSKGDPALKTVGADYGAAIESCDGFAQVYPEHKFMLVEALRQRGYTVAMTGDGVNDAPALKRADVGIAVEGATDAAQGAADIVFTEPGLSTMISAIVLAREIFQRMKNYVIYRVACTIELVVFFFIAALAFHPETFPHDCDDPDCAWPPYFKIPVIGLVLITILNDGTIISIAYDIVEPSHKPEVWALPELFIVSTALGLVAVVSSLLLLVFCLNSWDDDGVLSQMGIGQLYYGEIMMVIYMKVSISDFLTVFAARTHGLFWSRRPALILLGAAIFAMGLSTIFSKYWQDIFGHPKESSEDNTVEMEGLEWKMILAIWVYSIVWFFIQDVCKVGTYKVMYYSGFSVINYQTDAEERKKEQQRNVRAQKDYLSKASHGSESNKSERSDTERLFAHMQRLENVLDAVLLKVYGDKDAVPAELSGVSGSSTGGGLDSLRSPPYRVTIDRKSYMKSSSLRRSIDAGSPRSPRN